MAVRNAKSRLMTRLDKLINSWQGWEAGNQTFGEDDWNFDAEEIRELLDDEK